MKKIFLIFTLFVSSYVFNEERIFSDYFNNEINVKNNSYEICSHREIDVLVACVNLFRTVGFKPLSGVHAVSTPEGTLFFQSIIKK